MTIDVAVPSVSTRSRCPAASVKIALNLSCVDWSPDMTRLVCEGFADDPAGNGVYTVAASDGQDLVRLTQQGDVPCSYSPDGTKILFIRNNPADEQHFELFTVNVDGSGETQV